MATQGESLPETFALYSAFGRRLLHGSDTSDRSDRSDEKHHGYHKSIFFPTAPDCATTQRAIRLSTATALTTGFQAAAIFTKICLTTPPWRAVESRLVGDDLIRHRDQAASP